MKETNFGLPRIFVVIGTTLAIMSLLISASIFTSLNKKPKIVYVPRTIKAMEIITIAEIKEETNINGYPFTTTRYETNSIVTNVIGN